MAVMPKFYKIHTDGCTVELEPIYEELIPVVHGRWVFGGDGIVECTRCNETYDVNTLPRNYCPNCGARNGR